MRLLFKSLERGILARSAYPGGYESEWFIITHTGWAYTIKMGDEKATLSRSDTPISQNYKDFKRLLTMFLDISFPS